MCLSEVSEDEYFDVFAELEERVIRDGVEIEEWTVY